MYHGVFHISILSVLPSFFLLYIIILLLFMPMLDHSFIKLPSKLCKAYASIDLLNVDFDRL